MACPATPQPSLDANVDTALEPSDAPSTIDGASDAYALPDAFLADLVVTHTRASGPGSLTAVIA